MEPPGVVALHDEDRLPRPSPAARRERLEGSAWGLVYGGTSGASEAFLARGRLQSARLAPGAPSLLVLTRHAQVRKQTDCSFQAVSRAGEKPVESVDGEVPEAAQQSKNAYLRNFCRRERLSASPGRLDRSSTAPARTLEQTGSLIVVVLGSSGGSGTIPSITPGNQRGGAPHPAGMRPRLYAPARRPARGSPRSPRARSPCRSRSPASTRDRQAPARWLLEPPSPITQVTIGTEVRRAISSCERARGPPWPCCSAGNPEPGTGRVHEGQHRETGGAARRSPSTRIAFA